MKKRTGVVICFYNDEGKILLQERGDYSKMGEKWAFFGGGVEEGETHFEAFLREAKEELDLYMNTFNFHYLGKRVRYYSEADYEATRHFYLVKTQMQRDDFNVLEGSGCEYFSIDEAKKLHFPFEMNEELDILEQIITHKI